MRIAIPFILFIMCYSISASAQDSLPYTRPISIAEELSCRYILSIQIDELPKTEIEEFLLLIDQNGLRLVQKDVISNPPVIRTCRPNQVITYIDGLPVSKSKQVYYAQPMKVKLSGLPAKHENETTLDIE
ncbi:MAG: hypothetical protein JXQ87_10875 [Bacteroidia bacterium]